MTVRDRHCRMPGCRRRAGRCDIDHGHPFADGGPTACANLCCLCRRHHRIKTFARGWSFSLLDDGRLVVRTPSGVSRTTRPPGWYPDPEPDPPELEELAPPDPLQL
ncbi:HNH endonuclease signature motif containing protein [Blastococcus atacamensis]|uniref:HNH endonuclease signature motif containing protein n=1 Tax=Blastococcus atacamensis TaxID=2070508 RepID=UPI000CEBB414